MSAVLVAQNKTNISVFPCVNFILFFRYKQNTFSEGFTPISYQGFALDSLGDLARPPDPQLYTKALRALLSVHLNNRSIKKTLFRPLQYIFYSHMLRTYN